MSPKRELEFLYQQFDRKLAEMERNDIRGMDIDEGERAGLEIAVLQLEEVLGLEPREPCTLVW